MRIFRFFLLFALPFIPFAANAQVRTWVSGDGLDSNPCTRSAPCRNFDAAINAVAAGGEVVALDSAGYGPITINKGVAVVAPAGIHAAIAPTSGAAVQILEANVVIRGLYLNSQGAVQGISIEGNATNVHVENCVIDGFVFHGLFMESNRSGATLNVLDSIFRNNRSANSNAPGAMIQGGGVRNVATFDHCRFEGNNFNLLVSSNARVTVRDSIAMGGSYGFWAAATAQSGPAELNIENSVAANNSVAIYTSGANTATTIGISNSAVLNSSTGVWATAGTVRIGGTTVSRNTTGLLTGGGTIISFGNNQVDGNTTNGTPSSTVGTI